MTNEKFEKINMKIVIGIQQYNSVQNLSDFVELQILGPIFFKKNMTDKNFEKMNIKIVVRI